MQFQTVDQIERSLIDDHAPGEEIAPGVVISRRSVLSLSALALAWLALPAPVRATLRSNAKGAEGERIEVVMAEVRRLATELIADENADEEAYLKAVHALTQRMQAAPEPWFGWQVEPGKWDMDVAWYSQPVVLYQLKFEPDAVIDLHDHRHYNGLLMGVEGSIEVRNFDIVPEANLPLDLKKGVVPPPGREFLVRQTTKQVLEPGKASTLTRDRDNLHVVKAGPKGGVCLDLFTHFNNQARSYSLEWSDNPEPGTSDRFRAVWKGD